MTFQEVILKLEQYWARQGCVIEQPYDLEVGAGTMHPATFLHALGPEPWRAAFVQPCRRPADARYGKNPNRLFKHYQYQVLLKPAPKDVQDLYLQSLEKLTIKPREHDIRFLEDDWEAPTLGASGVGWQIFLDGQEITQFTYFQQMGGIELDSISVEITYGVERMSMYIQRVSNVFELQWGPGVKYGDIRLRDEAQQSTYAFEEANIDLLKRVFELYEREAWSLLEKNVELPAYDFTLKCSHLFNLLDARGAVGIAERTALIGRCRALSKKCAEVHLENREFASQLARTNAKE